jgi:xanthine/CO dehydrogenase XdhC/CoxF family maturation factor
LERDVIQKSRLTIVENRPRLLRYDTAEAGESFGLGCGGEIVIYLEPISSGSPHLHYLKQIQSCQQPAVLVTAFSVNTGGAVALLQSGELASRAGLSPHLIDFISHIASGCLRDAQTRTVEHTPDRSQLLCEYIAPARNLVLFGAGPQAMPLARCADALGFRVTVVDERPATISRIRGLLPASVVFSRDVPLRVLERIECASSIACVIATHNVSYDLRALNAALSLGAFYIGLLGPKHRSRELMDSLFNRGCDSAIPRNTGTESVSEYSDATSMQAIHTPAGLDIGGDTPEQIALSILAEIQAVFAGRTGGFLRNRNAPIHDQTVSQTEHATV